MKTKLISLFLVGAMSVLAFAGCSTGNTSSSSSAATTTGSQAASTTAAETSKTGVTGEISVISREDGSGTRGAFIELLGIEEKNADGSKVDKTTKEADIANKTDVMMTMVAGNPQAIGYISLGSLNDTVKALKVEGVEATAENIKNKSYKVARPFNVAVKGEASGVAKDFMNFIMSKEGQAVITGNKYIAVDEAAAAFTSDKSSGKIVVAGSSSVTPVMEKLVEAYKAINAGADIEVQQSDSTAGMQAAMNGTCDIGMASRELKESELAELKPTVIAMDGIAVIVNNDNTLEDISGDAIKGIYTGEVTTWEDVK